MKLFGKDLTRDVVVIAEIGVNHEGNVEVASALVRAAAEAGADAVKFQSYTPERFISPADAERFARVTRFALDSAAHRRLAGEAAQAGIAFFSSAISEDWVPIIAELSPAIKIASGDLTFETVIRMAAATGRQVVLSTGCGTTGEIDQAINWVRSEVGDVDLANRLVLLHCVSAYPAPIDQCNLKAIPFLRYHTGLEVGWSNHVIGSAACIAAVALGASVIEVHVTDRKTGREFRDHELSFEPEDLALLVATLRGVRAALGDEKKMPQAVEVGVRDAIRKGIIAAVDIPVGTVLSAEHLMFARPGTEFPATELARLIGRRTAHPIARLEKVRPEMLSGGI